MIYSSQKLKTLQDRQLRRVIYQPLPQ